MIDCATTFLLAPRVVQIFYGDEIGCTLSDAQYNVDSDQAFRSDMNWHNINHEQLLHFQKLSQIRSANPVIGCGLQRTIDVHTCIRYNDSDTLLIRLEPSEWKPISVQGLWQDSTQLIELYTNQTALVKNGQISFPYYQKKVAIIKPLK